MSQVTFIRLGHAGLLERGLVVDHGVRVVAEIDAVELAVDPAAVERCLVEVGDVERLAEELVERQQRAAAGIFRDIAVIHLDQVRRIAAGRLGGEARPVIAPGQGLTVDLYARVSLLIERGRFQGTVGSAPSSPTNTGGRGHPAQKPEGRPAR